MVILCPVATTSCATGFLSLLCSVGDVSSSGSLLRADLQTVTVKSRPSPQQQQALPAHTDGSHVKYLSDYPSVLHMRVLVLVKYVGDSNLKAIVCRNPQFLQAGQGVFEITLHPQFFRHLCHCYLLTYLQNIQKINCSICCIKVMDK